jgi:hypothetical protein
LDLLRIPKALSRLFTLLMIAQNPWSGLCSLLFPSVICYNVAEMSEDK